jgi:hypothetical protein
MKANQLAFLLFANACLLLAAQQASEIHSTVSRTLQGMSSERWVDRKKAFSEMPNIADIGKQDPNEADQLKVGLIHLLNFENAEAKKRKGLTEEHSEYYAAVVGAVADLDDERAIPSLLGAITSGGMATRALARFGDKALGQVLEQLRSPDDEVRSSALFTVRDLLEMHIAIAPASRARIRDAIRSSLGDPEFLVRGSAIAVIEYLDDREEFVPVLEKLAQSDPVKLPGKPDDGGDGGQFYPLRQDARKLLRKIANHEPPVVDQGVDR